MTEQVAHRVQRDAALDQEVLLKGRLCSGLRPVPVKSSDEHDWAVAEMDELYGWNGKSGRRGQSQRSNLDHWYIQGVVAALEFGEPKDLLVVADGCLRPCAAECAAFDEDVFELGGDWQPFINSFGGTCLAD
jgi:hypothetical protein